jgi:hypothetical protein
MHIIHDENGQNGKGPVCRHNDPRMGIGNYDEGMVECSETARFRWGLDYPCPVLRDGSTSE